MYRAPFPPVTTYSEPHAREPRYECHGVDERPRGRVHSVPQNFRVPAYRHVPGPFEARPLGPPLDMSRAPDEDLPTGSPVDAPFVTVRHPPSLHCTGPSYGRYRGRHQRPGSCGI